MLLCLSSNHGNASFELLEKLSFVAPEATAALVDSTAFVTGAVVLATCNRFEAYVDMDEPVTAAGPVGVEAVLLAADSLTFEEAVSKYSTDEETKNQGGRVINPRSGGLFHGVDELERTQFFLINELRPGEHSQPTAVDGAEQQAYGLYRLDERKPAHAANPQQDYELFQMKVEADLRQAKLDKWTRRRLAETYVRLTDDFGSCTFDQRWFGDSAGGSR